MANYKNIVDLCRLAIPGGASRFIHGRITDFSNSYSGAYPLVTLLPFTVEDARSTPDATWDAANLVIGFWKEDRPDTTPAEREEIIAEMDALSDIFIDHFLDRPSIKLSSVQKEPQYQMFQGTLSGYAVQLRIQILAPC